MKQGAVRSAPAAASSKGSIALEEKRYADAIQAFGKSNQQDPRILYLTALAMKGAGDTKGAAAMGKKAAAFNQLSFNYAYVRAKAMKMDGTPLIERRGRIDACL